MGMDSQHAILRFQALMDQAEEPLKNTFQNIHQGYPADTLMRFLKARDWNVDNAHKMLLDCLKWRVQNEIDCILSKPILPVELYRAVRDSQLIGLSGYSREGLPVFAIGVGHSTFDKASVHCYVQSHIQINEYRDRIILPLATQRYGRQITTCIKVLDMTGLKLSALSHIKLLSIISTIDDLNYPEKTNTYYIVNAPYVFSACWKALDLAKEYAIMVFFEQLHLLTYQLPPAYLYVSQVVKPLLQERTRKKVQVLPGCGRDELLKIIDYDSLPHFCRKEGSGSSRHTEEGCHNCFSLDHPFHQQLYSYVKQQSLFQEHAELVKLGSFHVDLPEPPAEETEIVQTIESEMHKLRDENGLPDSTDGSNKNND